jgi:hypothetical protein
MNFNYLKRYADWVNRTCQFKNLLNLILVLGFMLALGARADVNRAGLFVYKRLAGKPLTRAHPQYAEIFAKIEQGDLRAVADYAVLDKSFYYASVSQWAALIVSADQSEYSVLDDAFALLMGFVRDNQDARQLLKADVLYEPDPRLGLQPLLSSNQAYLFLEQSRPDYLDYLYVRSPQWHVGNLKEAAGILTTRGWAQRNYLATNRVAIKNSFQAFLCTPIENWKTPFLPTKFIRQDIDRMPAGNPVEFQRDCRSCHASMDALAGAFAYASFRNGEFVMTKNVNPTYLRNADQYPEGYVTVDDRWTNFLTQGQNRHFGWSTPLSGAGIAGFGEMLASSDAFGKCMVKRVYRQVCGVEPISADLNRMSQDFREDGFRLKNLFKNVAIDSTCRGEGV